MSITKLVCCLVLISASSGCIAFHMRYASPRRPVEVSSEQATVVFIRPVHTGIREGLIITVVDGHGDFLGQLNDGDHFVAQLAPGRRQLVGFFKGKADLVEANLAAGEVYYVQVTAEPDMWMARATFQVLHPHPAARQHVQELLDETRQLVPLVRQARRELNPEEVSRKVGIARVRWAEYEFDQRAARTLSPADGLGPLH
jgi:hypothetical protein